MVAQERNLLFTPHDITARLRERPFAPFRIIASTGRSFDVYHPDLVLVARRFLIVGTTSSEDPEHAELVDRVAILHITELQDLPVPQLPESGGNGRG
jgi:hypothetical protein